MNTDSILKNLNKEQIEAVKAISGPVLIIAGAGSGKTRTLAHRVAYLISKGVKPWNILAVTFTNKAANEMKERVIKILKIDKKNYFYSKMPVIGTFHSVCARILRQEVGVIGFDSNFLIYDTTDQLGAVRKVMRELGINTKDYNPRAVLGMISSAKNELIGPEGYEESADGHIQELVSRIYFGYRKLLEDNNALDFDDLLMKTVQIFEKYPQFLKKYQKKFQHILVDEYQDTNHAQYVIVNLLAKGHRNICVVGDDAQAIYSWRGADIRNILEFERDYPNAKVFKLEQNYRSTKNILNAARKVIEENINKKDKNLWTNNVEGEKVKAYEAIDEMDEAMFVLEKAKVRSQKAKVKVKSQKFTFSDMAVLYRTNAQSRVLEEALLSEGIPYRIVGALRFYERKEIKDMLAYLRVVASDRDFMSFRRIASGGEKTLDAVERFLREEKSIIGGIEKLRSKYQKNVQSPVSSFSRFKKSFKKLDELKNVLEESRKFLKNNTVSGLVDFVARKSGYKKMLLDGTLEGEARWENVCELKSVASKYSKGAKELEKFLEEVALVQDTDNYDENTDAMTLMTLHAAKGLEFPIVFICGMEEGLFPHARSYIDPEQMEEERRLCYVGMTRAKSELYLLCASSRKLFGRTQLSQPSQFLEIENLEWIDRLDGDELIKNEKKPEGILDKILNKH
ncbi:MAG: hypothetical protein ACD_63C00170G0003 [uncultured bacterium]|nr:MAG: hypothetical protein ACD_63C00170G0003 [uncultured bacterium]